MNLGEIAGQLIRPHTEATLAGLGSIALIPVAQEFGVVAGIVYGAVDYFALGHGVFRIGRQAAVEAASQLPDESQSVKMV